MALSGGSGAVSPDEVLWRRVPPGRLKEDAARPGAVLPQSDAFRVKGGDDGVSVERGTLHRNAGRGPEVVIDHPDCDDRWGVLEISVADVIDVGLDVIPDPLPENPLHALIVPPPSSGKSGRLSARAKWVITPPWPQ